jgi:predicted lipid-binding transport protein (Tim44 family)
LNTERQARKETSKQDFISADQQQVDKASSASSDVLSIALQHTGISYIAVHNKTGNRTDSVSMASCAIT